MSLQKSLAGRRCMFHFASCCMSYGRALTTEGDCWKGGSVCSGSMGLERQTQRVCRSKSSRRLLRNRWMLTNTEHCWLLAGLLFSSLVRLAFSERHCQASAHHVLSGSVRTEDFVHACRFATRRTRRPWPRASFRRSKSSPPRSPARARAVCQPKRRATSAQSRSMALAAGH